MDILIRFQVSLKGAPDSIRKIYQVFNDISYSDHETLYPFEKLISQDPSRPDDLFYRSERSRGSIVVIPSSSKLMGGGASSILDFLAPFHPTLRFLKILCQSYEVTASVGVFSDLDYFDGKFVFDVNGCITKIKLDESVDRGVFIRWD